MMQYHVCKCGGIIRQWRGWGWSHLLKRDFKRCGQVARPDIQA